VRLLSVTLLKRWLQVCPVKITFTILLTNRFVCTTKMSMKFVLNWIPLRIRVRSRNSQPHRKAHSTPRFVKLQSKEDTLDLPLKFPDYWGVRKRVSSFQNLYDFWGRKRTNQFLILLDCSFQEQSYWQPIVFDLVCLIYSNLTCHCRAPVRCWWWQTHVCWWTQMLDTTTAPHMYSKFIDASNMQICGGCAEHPSLEWPWILYHLLFWFGSVEIAQKYMCCVQVIDVKTKPHACAKFNHASNVQMCIVCSDSPFI